MTKTRSGLNNPYRFSILNLCVSIFILMCVCVPESRVMNELLNHTIDLFFLSDTGEDLGQLNRLFGGSCCISSTLPYISFIAVAPQLLLIQIHFPLFFPILILSLFCKTLPTFAEYCFEGGGKVWWLSW